MENFHSLHTSRNHFVGFVIECLSRAYFISFLYLDLYVLGDDTSVC